LNVQEEIFFHSFDHSKEFPGDGGIRFEENPAHPVPQWFKNFDEIDARRRRERDERGK